MKDKLNKLNSLIKKYGFLKTIKKIFNYFISNLINLFYSINFIKNKKILIQLDEILNNIQYDRIIIWKSKFGWNVPLFQRPQHILSNMQNSLVFYEVTYFTDRVNYFKKINNNLILINLENKIIKKLLYNKLNKIKKPKYIQIYSTDWNMKLSEMKNYIKNGYKIIYEYIDEINPILFSSNTIPINVKEKYEYMLTNTNDIFVVVTANKLEQDIISKRGLEKLVFACNGVDYSHFQELDKNYKFDTQFEKIINENKKIIGYYGAFASWFDYDMLKYLAKQRPEYNIVLFGAKYDNSLNNANLKEQSNIYFLGSKQYNILQNYANKFDVCIIPFLINEITQATSPVKLFEYMALEKPIVTTSMEECKKYKSVFIANNKQEFVSLIDNAVLLNKNKDIQYFEVLKKEALENTWEKKAKLITNMLEKYEQD